MKRGYSLRVQYENQTFIEVKRVISNNNSRNNLSKGALIINK